MKSLILPFQFSRPSTQMHPYWKECLKSLDRHGWCIVRDELMVDRVIGTAEQIELFRESCRHLSIEKDQEIVGSEHVMPPHLVLSFAPQGQAGSMPDDAYIEDSDGMGIMGEIKEKPLSGLLGPDGTPIELWEPHTSEKHERPNTALWLPGEA